jgi:hypothetical protein
MEFASHPSASGRSFSMPSVSHHSRPSLPASFGQFSDNDRNHGGVTRPSPSSSNSNYSNVNVINRDSGNSSSGGRTTNSTRSLLTSALQEAQTAVEFDNLGMSTEAIDSYNRAIALLSVATQFSTLGGVEHHRLQTIVSFWSRA